MSSLFFMNRVSEANNFWNENNGFGYSCGMDGEWENYNEHCIRVKRWIAGHFDDDFVAHTLEVTFSVDNKITGAVLISQETGKIIDLFNLKTKQRNQFPGARL